MLALILLGFVPGDTPSPPATPSRPAEATATPTGRPEPLPVLADEAYRTACGPIAATAALRAVGDEVTLGAMIKACGWAEGRQTPFATLAGAISARRGIAARAVRLAPGELLQWIAAGDRAAILPVRKFDDGTDHAVAVVGAKGGQLRVVDYPELAYDLAPEALASFWNGEAILISRAPGNGALLVAAGVAPGLLAAFVLARRREAGGSKEAGR